jgi:hypothetical protein
MSKRYLVNLDLERLSQHRIVKGGNLTQPELKQWLQRCGFEERPDGGWACTLESLEILEPDAIVGVKSL